MVALLGPVRLRLDDAEQRALGILLECGLVSEQEAGEAYAEPDLPDWVVESWQPSQEIQGGPVHEVQGWATG